MQLSTVSLRSKNGSPDRHPAMRLNSAAPKNLRSIPYIGPGGAHQNGIDRPQHRAFCAPTLIPWPPSVAIPARSPPEGGPSRLGPTCDVTLFLLIFGLSGSNSAVECQLPKLDVAGSIPVSRSTYPFHNRKLYTANSGHDRAPSFWWCVPPLPDHSGSSNGELFAGLFLLTRTPLNFSTLMESARVGLGCPIVFRAAPFTIFEDLSRFFTILGFLPANINAWIDRTQELSLCVRFPDLLVRLMSQGRPRTPLYATTCIQEAKEKNKLQQGISRLPG